MRHLIQIVLFLILSVSIPAILCSKSYEGYKLLSFQLTSQEQIDQLTQWVEENSEEASLFLGASLKHVTELSVSASALPELLQLLESWNVESNVQSENLGALITGIETDNENYEGIQEYVPSCTG